MNQADKYAVENFDTLADTAQVSVRVAAQVKGCSLPTIWRRIKSGAMPTSKDGDMRRITVAAVRASMRSTAP